jgi:hypothetical protein
MAADQVQRTPPAREHESGPIQVTMPDVQRTDAPTPPVGGDVQPPTGSGSQVNAGATPTGTAPTPGDGAVPVQLDHTPPPVTQTPVDGTSVQIVPAGDTTATVTGGDPQTCAVNTACEATTYTMAITSLTTQQPATTEGKMGSKTQQSTRTMQQSRMSEAVRRQKAEQQAAQDASQVAKVAAAASSITSIASQQATLVNDMSRLLNQASEALKGFEPPRNKTGVQADAYNRLKGMVNQMQAAMADPTLSEESRSQMRLALYGGLVDFARVVRAANIEQPGLAKDNAMKQWNSFCRVNGLDPYKAVTDAGPIPASVRAVLTQMGIAADNPKPISALQEILRMPQVDGQFGKSSLLYLQVSVFDQLAKAVNDVDRAQQAQISTDGAAAKDSASLASLTQSLNSYNTMKVAADALTADTLTDMLRARPQIGPSLKWMDFRTRDGRMPSMTDMIIGETMRANGYRLVGGALCKGSGSNTQPLTSDDMNGLVAAIQAQAATRYNQGLSSLTQRAEYMQTSGLLNVSEQTTFAERLSGNIQAVATHPTGRRRAGGRGGADDAVQLVVVASSQGRQHEMRDIIHRMRTGSLRVSDLSPELLTLIRDHMGTSLVERDGCVSLALPDGENWDDFEHQVDLLDDPGIRDALAPDLRRAYDAVAASGCFTERMVTALLEAMQAQVLPSILQPGDGGERLAADGAIVIDEAPAEAGPPQAQGDDRPAVVTDLGGDTSPAGMAGMAAMQMLAGRLDRFADLATDDPDDLRRDGEKNRAQALHDEARQEAEAYADAVQEHGRELVLERRRTSQVADTDVVNGQVIQKNADGTAIGTAQPANVPR